ncbi:MAG: FTR1 family protein [Candidatus Thermoplasmatota archaeon]|nr:FTR1 family protein [Candidatus Thermoplasmatota archaeon]
MAFITEAALIALREGLEALLITGILLGLVTRLGRPDARRHVWTGFWAAVATSLVAGYLVSAYLLTTFEQNGYGAWFELIAALAAVVTLTYMVFWMWSHTSQVLAEAKQRVRVALTTGSLATIVFITYISVIREGLETVLFYSALTSQASLLDILWSGALGFALSAVLVYLLLKTSKKIGLKRFFTATGAFLLIVAAMLLTHTVGALTELGYLDPQPAIWDTSAAIADDSITGRLLHATLGYTATPSLLQASLYFGYLFIAGGAYLYQAGFFHRATTQGAKLLRGRVAVTALVVLLITSLVATAGANPTDTIAGHSHGGADEGLETASLPSDAQVAVLLRNHGEPIYYNETTYQSFADFTERLLRVLGFGALLEVDQGTVLLDKDQPFANEPSLTPSLMDAWTHDHAGPAVWVGSPFPDVQQVPMLDGYYLAPGGPGLGEPDVLESAGLSAYQSWLQMEGYSPMHQDKEVVLERTIQLLEARYGEQVDVTSAYHIIPHAGPDERLEDALANLDLAGADLLVDAYTSHLHSDIMNTCMMQPTFQAALEETGYDGDVVASGPAGTTQVFAQGLATSLAETVEAQAGDGKVAILLTHHGMTPGFESPCRAREDPYNQQAQAMFEATAEALNASLDPALAERTLILQVYGSGAGDPDDGVLSPEEALEEAAAWGAQRVLDVPYELPGNGYDNLVNHRLSYGFTPDQAPYYGPGYETTLTRDGMHITVLSSAFAVDARAQAQAEVIAHVIDKALAQHTDEHAH